MTLRDGMQILNRDAVIPLEERRRLAETLQRAGLPYIEVGSFVNPRVITSMGDTAELFALLDPRPGQELAALVPTLKYYRQLTRSRHVDTVALLASASEKYARLNTNASRDQALRAACEVAAAARGDGYRVRAYLSYAFREMGSESGAVPVDEVGAICERLIAIGCETIALSDTDGRATPREVTELLEHLAPRTGLEHIGVHLHDRYGLGVANALLAYQAGVRAFDSTIGGVGGNQLIENAVGNIATEELVYLFDGLGVDTGVDFAALLEAGRLLVDMVRAVGDPLPPSKILANQRFAVAA